MCVCIVYAYLCQNSILHTFIPSNHIISISERFSMNFYMSIYAAAAVLLGFVTFLRSFLLTRLGVSASRTLHKDLLSSIIRAPMSFFDTTPTG